MTSSVHHFPPFRLVSLLLWSLSLLNPCQVAHGFYLPGVAPKDFVKGEEVPIFVNALSSAKTVLPYDFYYDQFHFCRPKDITPQSESLGSILFGDRLYTSPISINMLQEKSCIQLCSSTIPKDDAQFINARISERYMMHWVVDGLPAGRNASTHFTMGFALGAPALSEEEQRKLLLEGPPGITPTSLPSGPILFNHYDITILYHTNEKKKTYRVVGVLVVPKSVKSDNGKTQCETPNVTPLSESADSTVSFSYSVNWLPSNIPWGTRWDVYLHMPNEKVHWFSIINSAVIVLLLSGMVALILLRALHKDISRYNAMDPEEDLTEEFGWKLVHGDVFRPPSHAMLLCVAVGNGAQVFLMTLVTLVFAALGFLSPSSRGSLSTMMLVFYVVFASVAGYVSSRLYKMMGEKSWRQNVVLTSFLVPGFIFAIFIVLNFFLISAKSSGAVPFGTMFSLFALWFLVSAPLCAMGAFYGFKKDKIPQPVRTHQIPRQVPDQPRYLYLPIAMALGGLLPFGALFIELFYIMNSVWSHRVFYVFGFLLVVYLILVLTCTLVSIIFCYFQLCAENYYWWWRSFFISGSTGIYVFLYGVAYYWTKLHIENGPSSILYFGYTFIMSLFVFLMTGAIGFTAAFVFIQKIYASIKID